MAKTNFKTTEGYINTFPKEVRELLQATRKTIKEEIPGAEETISYQIPTFKMDGKYVIYFSAWKNHLSLYPFSAAMGKAMKESASYNTSGKGTIQFPFDKPLPLSLIRKIVQYRLKENQEKPTNK